MLLVHGYININIYVLYYIYIYIYIYMCVIYNIYYILYM